MGAIRQLRHLVESDWAHGIFKVESCDDHRIELALARDGSGTFSVCEVVPGMLFSRYRMRTEGFDLATAGIGAGLKLNYCTAGRLEAQMRHGRYLYLAPGDLSAETSTAAGFSFPCGLYEGVELFIPEETLANAPAFFVEAGIDLAATARRIGTSEHEGNWTRRATEGERALLDAAARAAGEGDLARLRLLLAGLLLDLAEAGGMQGEEAPRSMLTKGQVTLAKRAHGLLFADLAQRMTIAEIAARLGTSPTTLKGCYAGVYGESISNGLRRARIDAACELLRESPLTVADIARQVGYRNPAKFAAVFKTATGTTPRAWRMEHHV